MADTTDTTPGTGPGVIKTGADGGLPDLDGRRAWVWMQDPDHGGRYDVRSDRVDMWRRKGARVVPDYPLHFGPSGRPAKSASPRRRAAQDVAEPAQATPVAEPVAQDVAEPAGEDPAAPGDSPPVADPQPDMPEQSAPADPTIKTRKGGRTR